MWIYSLETTQLDHASRSLKRKRLSQAQQQACPAFMAQVLTWLGSSLHSLLRSLNPASEVPRRMQARGSHRRTAPCRPMYPLIAMIDILYRLIRCKMDPGINAALLVIFTSIAVLGPARRLSWQIHGEDRKRMLDDDGNWFPSSLRGWITVDISGVLPYDSQRDNWRVLQ
jgi:hypothetical protein